MRDRFRLYDNGGKSIDRYTLIDAKPHDNSGWVVWHDYIAFNSEPFHPQGFGQHGEYERVHSDRLDLTYGTWDDVSPWKRCPSRRVDSRSSSFGIAAPLDTRVNSTYALL